MNPQPIMEKWGRRLARLFVWSAVLAGGTVLVTVLMIFLGVLVLAAFGTEEPEPNEFSIIRVRGVVLSAAEYETMPGGKQRLGQVREANDDFQTGELWVVQPEQPRVTDAKQGRDVLQIYAVHDDGFRPGHRSVYADCRVVFQDERMVSLERSEFRSSLGLPDRYLPVGE